MFHIVLVEPEIPQNTGNIARTCRVTGSALHLVRPLGFEIDDKKLKRAGLDYWNELELYYHDSLDELLRAYPKGRFFCLSTHANKRYSDAEFRDGDFLVFGKETAGLGSRVLTEHADMSFRIPMGDGMRSLNLSNSVALVLYEALRQNDYFGMV
ncbi:MAG TPA: tRNA (uridine(34)/cytosine(34)/5-carboxymethylaminomethyluridine(34)-2'-O)-methyltransferase TrmL [Eubacteriales bacterium]|nr:tRNA (uridine(34)/cytosine(34)/5-carboxymethylaminomethyluridine(34)-2'-O)-methyltransferase TrmL [Clostridia bacterium]HRV73810.1 tRNA (uridine(34)/cytosine(34)/5-carboxymethylaminomethyluridine(34)-2'-O)-methyltransferase TrmL [Eubacteriales bacterium]